MTREISRTCAECGDTITITVHDDGSYDGGYYFGEVTMPDKDSSGEYEKTGEWDGFDVVRWTGEEQSFEYWVCDSCHPIDDDGLTKKLAEKTDTTPEEIERGASELGIEPPWDAREDTND